MPKGGRIRRGGGGGESKVRSMNWRVVFAFDKVPSLRARVGGDIRWELVLLGFLPCIVWV